VSVMVDTHVGGNGSAPMYKSGPHCWACGYTDTPYIQGTRIRARNAAVLYEIAVETVEDMTGPFTVAELWNAGVGVHLLPVRGSRPLRAWPVGVCP
jgi:hypothetical protein